MSSANNVYGEFFKNLYECNTQLFKTFNENSTTDNSMQEAMMQQNSKDLCSWFEETSKQPEHLLHTQMKWWQDQMQIWQNSMVSNSSQDLDAIIEPEKYDLRFDDPAWQKDVLFDTIKQSYLLFSKNMFEMINQTQGLNPDVKQRLNVFSRQMINAMSPSNFVLTNPELMRLTVESKGENLIRGMEQFQEDLQASSDLLKVRMTPKDSFKLGRDLALTAGEVVFRNHLLELIQYHPQTEQVNARPIFIVPPFVNKYYIMDMRKENSMVNWLVEQGHTVFLISWRNPDASLADSGFDDYVLNGIIASLETIETCTGEQHVNAIGYCIGGTLLSTAMAYMVSKRSKQRIKSATLLTTILDFSNPGELGVYINQAMVTSLEQRNKSLGYMDGRQLAVTFNLLRENSLHWNYYIDNYLKGVSPVDFDFLFWSTDSTNVTAECHNFILRQLYLENQLKVPKSIQIQGTGIDLTKVKVPVYYLSTSEDHIAEWKGTYASSQLLSGEVTFVLGESGHIAGVINPPYKNKYGYWEGGKQDADADAWLEAAKYHKGSWWSHWQGWLEQLDKEIEKVPARNIEPQASLAPAPGTYVLQQLPI
ncbi:class I poly(R)-hydroxyalkanoic acid synthase [Shewanella sp. YLB-07]|uniref:class I poly(R)-hydroxyalkanoic acid synthase n=1 Tax=Shewanella sp. YLB-07 TaxID=2601268 RepID=UPI00128E1A1D|nr:class I poly(R)-hydroxyalkanoic acid synthase [Shewanella sp. YLB-07]MPY26673.1 class I poly(R)-hydroxyalkanoic acid synthase [Shewanella sp. YLB-07]